MRQNRLGMIIGLIIVIGITIFLIFKYKNSQNYSWREWYIEDKKDPYTLFLAAEILKDYYPSKDFYQVTRGFKTSLKQHKQAKGNYIFFGEQYYITEEATDTLLGFIAKGNTALIATKKIPYRLIFRLFDKSNFCESMDYEDEPILMDSSVTMNLLHPNLKLPKSLRLNFMNRYESEQKHWTFISSKYVCPDGLHPAGLLNDKYINFGYFPYGKGRIYFHTNPIVFTNYYLMRPNGKAYFDAVMAHFPSENIYYDIAARSPIFDNLPRQNHNARMGQKGPLSYILSQPELAAAWYLLLTMGLLFLIFRSKRKQRIIPIIDQNKNTSLIFIQNISNLYFQQGDNRALSFQKFIYFQEFIRTKYGMNFKNKNDTFSHLLAQKSGIDEQKIKEILVLHESIAASTFLSEATFSKFHLAINHFYKTCK